MEIAGQAVLLRVFIGESDKVGHLPLFEAIVNQWPDADSESLTLYLDRDFLTELECRQCGSVQRGVCSRRRL